MLCQLQVMVHNINFVEESQKKPPIAQKQPIAHHTYEKPVAAKQANSFNGTNLGLLSQIMKTPEALDCTDYKNIAWTSD